MEAPAPDDPTLVERASASLELRLRPVLTAALVGGLSGAALAGAALLGARLIRRARSATPAGRQDPPPS